MGSVFKVLRLIYSLVIELIVFCLMLRVSFVLGSMVLSLVSFRLGTLSLFNMFLFSLAGYLIFFYIPLIFIKRYWLRSFSSFLTVIEGEPEGMFWFSSNYFDSMLHKTLGVGSIDYSLGSFNRGRFFSIFRFVIATIGFNVFVFIDLIVKFVVKVGYMLFSVRESFIVTSNVAVLLSYVVFIVGLVGVSLLYSSTEHRFYYTFNFSGIRK